MALRNIKQGPKERVEEYYERVEKLSNSLRIPADDGFLNSIFIAGLLRYLRLATAGLQRDILFNHKEAAILCEEGVSEQDLAVANKEYAQAKPQKEPPNPKPSPKIKKICGCCGKLGHGDDECWYNPNNRNINTEVIPTVAVEAQPHPNPPPTRPYVPPPSPSPGRGYRRSTYQGGRPNDNTGGRGRGQMPQQPGSGPMGGNMTSYREEQCYTCNEIGHRGRDCLLA